MEASKEEVFFFVIHKESGQTLTLQPLPVVFTDTPRAVGELRTADRFTSDVTVTASS